MRAPFKRPWWRCQSWHWWSGSMITVDICPRWRWHRGAHDDQHWQAVHSGWMLRSAVVGPHAGRVFR